MPRTSGSKTRPEIKERNQEFKKFDNHQEDGRLTTTVYQKPTHTDRHLSFSSHHPSMHERAVVKSLMDRAAKIPTTKSDQIKEKQRVISTLQSNGYPKRFILDARNFKPSVKDTTPLAESVRGYSTTPYVAGPLSQLREFWKTMASKWHLNPIRQLVRCFQNGKTKWIKKILVIPFTTFHVLIAARFTLAKRRENS